MTLYLKKVTIAFYITLQEVLFINKNERLESLDCRLLKFAIQFLLKEKKKVEILAENFK